ncbi:MAG: RNA polymerase sporulation sigma factor SigH, partial [Bacillota bacterium]|nr:RNA polymerase sporulation sigma factor SigH [Bacillota bacterium]
MSTEFETKINEQFFTMEDEEIVDLVHQGDGGALDYLIHKYRNFVRAKA